MNEIKIIETRKKVLEENEEIAAANKDLLEKKGIKAIEFLGGPGSGKTHLIHEIAKELKEEYNIAYVGGDMAGKYDAEFVGKVGIPSLQINTGNMCHLEAFHLKDALQQLELDAEKIDLLLVENVGNLICPFEVKIGTHKRIVLVDPAEGKEKFKKYPTAFLNSNITVISKIDLIKALEVNLDEMLEAAHEANPQAKVVKTSAKTGKGIKKLISTML